MDCSQEATEQTENGGHGQRNVVKGMWIVHGAGLELRKGGGVGTMGIAMNARPVKGYRKPKYPNRQEVVANPELLRQHVPARWMAIPEVAGAMAILLAANSGCGGRDRGVAVVAPIFEHGQGRAVMGCVVVTPPAFLSEEEAMQVIQEELGKRGVSISGTNQLAGVKTRMSVEEYVEGGGRKIRHVGPKKPLRVVSLATKKPAAIKVVTLWNYPELGGVGGPLTVQGFDTKGLAKALGQQVREEGREPINLGIFYDPMEKVEAPSRASSGKVTDEERRGWRKEFEESRKAKKVESMRLLRMQVQDFVKWLEGQGVI